MKEQNALLNFLTGEPKIKRRLSIKKILILAFTVYIIYYVIGIITKRLFWEPKADCTWIKDKKPPIICSKICDLESLTCRQNCSKGDQGCYKKCYDNFYLPCYEDCYESTTAQIKKCETS